LDNMKDKTDLAEDNNPPVELAAWWINDGEWEDLLNEIAHHSSDLVPNENEITFYHAR
jgi:hypothetical protein